MLVVDGPCKPSFKGRIGAVFASEWGPVTRSVDALSFAVLPCHFGVIRPNRGDCDAILHKVVAKLYEDLTAHTNFRMQDGTT